MVREQIEERGVRDPRVLAALRAVPRHRFLPADVGLDAYADRPIGIGHGQTASQPFVVAFMTEALGLRGDERVLEVGAGSGYQTAVLARLVREVHALERVPELAERARARLASLGVRGVSVRQGDGSRGLPELAPFGAILVAAAAPRVPEALLEQLAPGARLVIPVGAEEQELFAFERTARGWMRRALMPVRFVPLVGGPGG
jgi:protein-L-isoaspartate(D-aspartate) O-methyltransferase